MNYQKSLNRLTLFILAGFIVTAGSLAYWSVIQAPSMLARDDNPRLVEVEQSIKRGTIYDRSGQILAESVPVRVLPSGWQLQQRTYPHLEAASAVGYYSLVHGVGGIEESFDKTLRGDDSRDANAIALDNLLHRPEVGSDVRLTLDLNLQTTLTQAFGNHRGAIVLIDVPSGAVLAMVSAPSYDPNTLDANYDALFADKNAPLLNRVTQGIYQPGGTLETVILSAMLTDKAQLTDPVNKATTPIQINKLILNCAGSGSAITLIQAYSLACPAAFTNAVIQSPSHVQTLIDNFGLSKAPILINFRTLSGKASTPLTASSDSAFLTKQGAGQGDLTVTPLQMALVASTIANHGNAITPYMGDSLRRPGQTDWQALPKTDQTLAVITQDVADQIRIAMREAVASGAAHSADHANLTIYGHASIAYTGSTADSWFIGFIDLKNGHSIATAVVIEDANTSTVAAEIGGNALVAATQLPLN